MMARRTGQSFLELLQWHPRDMDTWTATDLQDEQDARFAAKHAGGG